MILPQAGKLLSALSVHSPKGRRRLLTLVPCVLLLALWQLVGMTSVVFEADTQSGGHVKVVSLQGGRFRQLSVFDRAIASVREPIKVGDPLHLPSQYMQALLVATAFVPRLEKVLGMGLHDGAFWAYLHNRFVRPEVLLIEEEPVLAEAYKADAFNLRKGDKKVQLEVAEPKKWIDEIAESRVGVQTFYDLIVQDSCDALPCTLLTVESLRTFLKMLSPTGVFAARLPSANAEVIRSVQDAFPHVYMVDTDGEELVLLAQGTQNRMHKEELIERCRLIQRVYGLGVDLSTLARDRFSYLKHFDLDASAIQGN